MTRPKRTLAEADSNAETAPAAKRTSTGSESTSNENNNKTSASGMGKKTTVSTKKSEGKKAAAAKESGDGAKTSKAASSQPNKAKSASTAESSDSEYICVCQPSSERAAELGIDSDEEDRIEELETCGGPACICKKPAIEHPAHKWIITNAGFKLVMQWQEQQAKRDQDMFGMYIFNDWSGYGTAEVMENMLLAFDKDAKKKVTEPMVLWSHVEGMAWFLNGDLIQWNMSDDSEGNAAIVAMFGTAILTTIDILIEHNLSSDSSSEVRNVGLVLSQLLRFASDMEDLCGRENDHGWKQVLVRLADKHGVEIKGRKDIDEVVQNIREEDEDEDEEQQEAREKAGRKKTWKPQDDYDDTGLRLWGRWDWKKEFAIFCKNRGKGPSGKVGGNHYDLTAKHNKGPKMKKYDLGGALAEDGEDSSDLDSS